MGPISFRIQSVFRCAERTSSAAEAALSDKELRQINIAAAVGDWFGPPDVLLH